MTSLTFILMLLLLLKVIEDECQTCARENFTGGKLLRRHTWLKFLFEMKQRIFFGEEKSFSL